MSEYSEDQFEQSNQSVDKDQDYKLKLSVDVRSVKNLKLAANLTTHFSIDLSADANKSKLMQFKAANSTVVKQSQQQETKLQDSFASYEFVANKA